MSTNLEKYLKRRRDSLDVETPDDQLIWEGISKGLRPSDARAEKRRILIGIRNIAAIALIALGVGYILNDIISQDSANQGMTLANIDETLGVRENEYRDLVIYKQKEAGSFNEIDNLIIAELFEEIQKLDTIYDQALKDLNELGFNEKVVHTIFDTYEKKIFLLELIILENNKIKKDETGNNIFL